MNSSNVELIAQCHCVCGENPLWDERRKLFYWTDIPTRRMFRLDPATGQHEQIYSGDQQVGGFTFQTDGALLLFRERDVAVLGHDGSVTVKMPFADEGVPRFNDVMAGPDGHVLAGTMGKGHRGGMYRVDHDGTITNLWRGTNCSNGMAFASDLATLYWTDTTGRRIDAFDYDSRSGRPLNRRPFISVSDEPGQGVPDGMTIDTEDRLYSTRYGGAGIYTYSPAGQVIDKIEMPVANITSCCFGGDDLCDLYITTAGGDPDKPQDDAGALFRVRMEAQGRAEFRSRIVV